LLADTASARRLLAPPLLLCQGSAVGCPCSTASSPRHAGDFAHVTITPGLTRNMCQATDVSQGEKCEDKSRGVGLKQPSRKAKSEASQKPIAAPPLQTSLAFHHRQGTLMHRALARTKHTSVPCCPGREPCPPRPLSVPPAAGRVSSAAGMAQGWQGPAMPLAPPHLAWAADPSLGLTGPPCQKWCKF